MHGSYASLSHTHTWHGTSMSTERVIPLPLLNIIYHPYSFCSVPEAHFV